MNKERCQNDEKRRSIQRLRPAQQSDHRKHKRKQITEGLVVERGKIVEEGFEVDSVDVDFFWWMRRQPAMIVFDFIVEVFGFAIRMSDHDFGQKLHWLAGVCSEQVHAEVRLGPAASERFPLLAGREVTIAFALDRRNCERRLSFVDLLQNSHRRLHLHPHFVLIETVDLDVRRLKRRYQQVELAQLALQFDEFSLVGCSVFAVFPASVVRCLDEHRNLFKEIVQ